MSPPLWSLVPLGLATILLAPQPAPASSATPPVSPRTPAAFEQLLARYDHAAPGPERDRLAREVDRAAGQRYATVSRLYWYTDLEHAKAAARRSGRPILSLRMLGRLDEDLSCMNSRLFRATLYANTRVSKLLRDRFVLHWSSVRPVPRVTIDFGDGRKIETTTTGNSAHYVLDADGRVLDVLPGVYAPVAFEAELTKTLALARRIRALPAPARAPAIRDHHQQLARQLRARRGELAGIPYVAGSRRLAWNADIDGALARAQRATFSKAYVEVPQLRTVGLDAGPLSDPARWAAAGQALYQIGDLRARSIEPALGVDYRAAAKPTPPRVLDDASRALVGRLHTARGQRATAAQLTRVIERLEHHLVADTALDQLELRPRISQRIAQGGGELGFEELDAWIYAEVFHTPRADAWLGLLPRTDFTGVPGDGVVAP